MPTSPSSKKPVVIITMGDPSGVGPEVTLKALASPGVLGLADFLVIGDSFICDKLKHDLGLTLSVPLLNIPNVPRKSFSYGKSKSSYGSASMEYIDKALELIDSGKASALVTAPVNKSSIRASGLKGFEGHTEYLAQKTATKDFAMMFVGPGLKVSLVTRHIALNKVPASLTIDNIYRTIALTHKYLVKYFKIRDPRIAVSGLNPHAGEGGAFGEEERKIIIPAIKKASHRMGGVIGPIPSDTVFYAALKREYDCVVAMYHDQALAPFKMLYFYNGVNLTIGLPFIRTSPDHGTAFNIAGKGCADPVSMIEAIKLACSLKVS
jgi:4-hydroxythreonine-4-phosphate dehydrogenase